MRKTFDQSIVESDAFLSLPYDAQVLYIHLNFEADSDGFIENVIKTVRICGAASGSLGALVESGFLIKFSDSLYVVRHWWVNNQMRKDRYTPTRHQKELKTLKQDEDGVYDFIKPVLDVPKPPEKRKLNEVTTDELKAESLNYEAFGLSKTMADEARKWGRYKKERNEPITETQLGSFVSNIKGYINENSEEEAIRSIEDSISNGYKGIVWGINRTRGKPKSSYIDRIDHRMDVVDDWLNACEEGA